MALMRGTRAVAGLCALALSLPATANPENGQIVGGIGTIDQSGALTQIKEMLSRYVTSIDLRTPDPGFEIEKLAHQAVTSVTLVLPDAEARVRLAALRRFIERYDLYRRKQIWPGVTNVRSRAELEACTAAKIPFVTGPAVCRMQTLPVGGRMQPLADLPLLAA